MSQSFHSKKLHILSSLSQDEQSYTDLSPKGSVDEGIRELVSDINRIEDFVTTSSCSGRVAVFLEGAQKSKAEPKDVNAEGSDVRASAGGKGGGEWLFTSHEPVDLETMSKPGELLSTLGLPVNQSPSFPQSNDTPRFIHFKFEPMILHILSSSPSQAQKALNAALSAGFRESGITSLINTNSRPNSSNPMIAVRTSGLAFDSIIGFTSTQSSGLRLMVSEEYLRNLIGIANSRFEVNAERTGRFRRGFLERVSGGRGEKDGGSWERADVRRERMRREGLERKRALLAVANGKNAHDGVEETLDSTDNICDFDTLTLQ